MISLALSALVAIAIGAVVTFVIGKIPDVDERYKNLFIYITWGIVIIVIIRALVYSPLVGGI